MTIDNNCDLLASEIVQKIGLYLGDRTQLAKDNSYDEAIFLRNGLRESHYLLAQKLNLDYINYEHWRKRRSLRKKSTILFFSGLGAGAVGGLYTYLGANNQVFADTSYVFFAAGGILTLLSFVNGVDALNYKPKILNKNGQQVSFRPSQKHLIGVEVAFSY